MRILGNILWIICGGLVSALSWMLAGMLWCITIIGIPVGLQCFKMASISLNPFGKEVSYNGGPASFLFNVVWFLVSGMELALEHFMMGVLLCMTIVGIPFGMQCFKMARLALCPFGSHVARVRIV